MGKQQMRLGWLKKVPIPALLFGGIAFGITGALPIPIGAAATNMLASWNSWILANTKYPTLTVFFVGLSVAWAIFQIVNLMHDRSQKLRLRLAQLRTEGVAIRNRGQSLPDNVSDWSAESLAWMERTANAIGAINTADAEWFRTLDAVPPPRISVPTTARVYAEHDFWLVKLEQLITRYSAA
jgi:hypothetical protein